MTEPGWLRDMRINEREGAWDRTKRLNWLWTEDKEEKENKDEHERQDS